MKALEEEYIAAVDSTSRSAVESRSALDCSSSVDSRVARSATSAGTPPDAIHSEVAEAGATRSGKGVVN
jgi:hypothetical protein